jgi:phosphoenolpyruvate carboxykinase (ATP)
MKASEAESSYGLENHGIRNVGQVHWNLRTTVLYEHIIKRQEGHVAHLGPIVVRTGLHTGRAAKDKYVVKQPSTEESIWWHAANQPLSVEQFDRLKLRMLAYLQGSELFVQDCYAGADPRYRLRVRVVNETAWHNLFVRTMFVRPKVEQLGDFVPELTIIHAPSFQAMPEVDGTQREAFVVLDIARGLVLIGGTAYAGEMKKSAFSVLNYLLPKRGVLSMHASANVGAAGDVAIFFGLSGTGKTTLSTDPERRLIGDDEHGWSDDGIFNFEGGCYAKVIRLSRESEPQIWACTRRFGTILENVTYHAWTRRLDLDDDALTENTRAAYPITHIDSAVPEGMGGHPRNVVMLACDAFGVMPPIARLTPEQAMYHFMSGYTAKIAGTERGVTEPSATFSACFGQPFMLLHPYEYAKLLAERVERHGADCWLVNTGWSGGPYGVGKRMSIGHTRALIRAALSGKLKDAPTRRDEVFGFAVPTACEGVPAAILDPRGTWSDAAAYDAKARELASRFRKNFEAYRSVVPAEVVQAGPKD